MALTKHRFLVPVFLGFVCYFGICHGLQGQQSRTVRELSTEPYKSEYSRLKSWREKRSFCIKLIDEGLIREDVNMRTLMDVFGSDVRVAGDPHGKYIITVLFETQPKPISPSEGSQLAYFGWYLRIIAAKGAVDDYFISNHWSK